MAIVINKETKEKSVMDTNMAVSSGKFWVFTDNEDPRLLWDFRYVKDVGGVLTLMQDAEREVVTAEASKTNLQESKRLKSLEITGLAKDHLQKILLAVGLDANIIVGWLLASSLGSTENPVPADIATDYRASYDEAFLRARAKYAELDLAETVEAVAAIVWDVT